MGYTIGYPAGCCAIIIERAILLMVSDGIKVIIMVTGGNSTIMTGIIMVSG
jgi:hypothetical protein